MYDYQKITIYEAILFIALKLIGILPVHWLFVLFLIGIAYSVNYWYWSGGGVD